MHHIYINIYRAENERSRGLDWIESDSAEGKAGEEKWEKTDEESSLWKLPGLS